MRMYYIYYFIQWYCLKPLFEITFEVVSDTYVEGLTKWYRIE